MSKAKRTPTPLDAQQFPLQAQTDATAGRDKVRENLPVHAPRHSNRPAEKSSKGGKGT